jgi:hypothetical protein
MIAIELIPEINIGGYVVADHYASKIPGKLL